MGIVVNREFIGDLPEIMAGPFGIRVKVLPGLGNRWFMVDSSRLEEEKIMDVNRLREISSENIELMIKKNRAYSGQSGDNITNTGLNGIAVRLMDKVTRLNNLTKNPENINYESVADTLNDISNYGLIGRLLEEGSWAEKPKLPRYVYLAGPINGIDTSDGAGWRIDVMYELSEMGIGSFSPMSVHEVGNLNVTGEIVANIDRYAISQCDILLVNLSGPGRAFGTIREIEYARSLNKRVIVICPELVSAFTHDVEVVGTLKEAIALILRR